MRRAPRRARDAAAGARRGRLFVCRPGFWALRAYAGEKERVEKIVGATGESRLSLTVWEAARKRVASSE